jgi:hypothetical protein
MTTPKVVFMLALLIVRHRFDAKRPLCSADQGASYMESNDPDFTVV